MFQVEKMVDGSFQRSYKIRKGISKQNIAIELLSHKGYNNRIVNRALVKLNELETT